MGFVLVSSKSMHAAGGIERWGYASLFADIKLMCEIGVQLTVFCAYTYKALYIVDKRTTINQDIERRLRMIILKSTFCTL